MLNDGYVPDTLESQRRRELLADIRRIKAEKRARKAEYCCLECGRKFYSTRAAENASYNGCPKCGGVDIDLYV